MRCTAFLGLLFCIVVGFVAFANQCEAQDRPNILLLLSDDHSYPYVSAYGDRNVKTPTLDRLASEGMLCHRFFTSAPQCVPSRAALMTGRSPVASRMTRFSSPLPADEITLPEILREKANYYTGICGRSFHLDGPGNNKQAEGIGALIEKHGLKTFAKRVDHLNTCADGLVASEVEKFLTNKPEGRPFFLWANFSDPHHVWNAPAEFRPNPIDLVLPGCWPDLPGMREQFADYCAEINRLDRTIDGVLKVLKDKGVFDQTLIVFLGDNGAALPHGKGSLYDPGSNVPCIVRWPKHVPAGMQSHALMSGEDIAPTMLAAAGIPTGDRMTGVNLLPVLRGETGKVRDAIYVERGPHGSAPVTVNMTNSGYDLARAVRTDHYKLIYNGTPWIPYAPVDSAGGPAWSQIKTAQADGKLAKKFEATYFSNPRPVYELYDLREDPSELNNRSGDASLAETETQLRTLLAEKMLLDRDYLPLPDLQVESKNKSKAKK